jgi:serine/threonine-protein kinase RsbW
MSTFELKIPADPKYVMVARMTASAVAGRVGFDLGTIDDIKQAVGEACNNAIRHGCGSCGNDCTEILLHMSIKEDALEIIVHDRGEGFTPLDSYKEIDISDYNDLPESGMGLMIIQSLMDEVVISSSPTEGTSVCMKKMLITATISGTE